MFRELLNRMIDDRLEEQAADKAHIAVTPEEVDAAIKNIAQNGRIAVKDLIYEARREGLSEQDYRDEIRRQVLEGKLVQLRVRGRVRVTEEDARAAYTHLGQGDGGPVAGRDARAGLCRSCQAPTRRRCKRVRCSPGIWCAARARARTSARWSSSTPTIRA